MLETILLTGGAGFLGRAVHAALRAEGVPAERIIVPRRRAFDLTREEAVERLYAAARPTVVIHLAAEVGGIGANQRNPGRFFYANMAMGLHLIEHARRNGVKKFVQIGTVCSYPKHTPAPFREDDLWNGYPEETNAPYGIAKRALFEMLRAYRAQYGLCGIGLLPANLYGPGDNFDPATSHVIPALIRRFCEARDRGEPSVTVWGTGEASREFLYVDDCARAVVLATQQYDEQRPMNVGTGQEVTIRGLAELIARTVGYPGTLVFNASFPEGQPRRRLDTSLAERAIRFRAETPLADGIARTAAWFSANASSIS